MILRQEETSVDLSYRPYSYWPDSPGRDVLLSRIKGKARRDIVREKLEKEGFTDLPAFLAREDLDEVDRKLWGSFHPMLIDGEYLPDVDDDEVEIARISLMSTTGDQISVRACRNGEKFRFKVVDEYDSEFHLAFDESERPLTLGEIIPRLNAGFFSSSVVYRTSGMGNRSANFT
ncbi:hypothetical protein N9H39_10315 [Gammaproteobacteria bacterium]|nr:hypothetical protein [Gammaproteobacteria bacterium]